jgi:hypothetical protein
MRSLGRRWNSLRTWITESLQALPRASRKQRLRRLPVEPLEERRMLAYVNNVHLINDTGSSSSDRITSDPSLAGDAAPGYGIQAVDFDHKADGTINGTASLSGSTFTYAPLVNDSSVGGCR